MSSTLSTDDLHIEASIFDKVIRAMTKKEHPKVYTDIKSVHRYPQKLHIVSTCKDADVFIISGTLEIPFDCKNKIIFGTRYFHLKNNDVVGAFFWQKGRPNILFYQKRLEKKGIKLDQKFRKYIEDDE